MSTAAPDDLGLSRLWDLTGQVAIVTGASSGLGERFARVLHAAGATVVAAARRTERLESLAASHERVLPMTVDVTSEGDVQRLVATTMERFGRLDVVVNNAGGGTPGKAVDLELADLRASLELNLVGLFDLARVAAGPMLEAGSGSVINVASMLGLVSSWPISNAAYSASKGAVVNLTRELACQWAAGGVRVNALAPGFFPSEGTAGLVEDERSRRWVERNCPMGRLGRPEELDGALLFLAGPGSTYVTGQTLVVDGGWTAH
jgi:NAD(P)-dependent dehydrogenase (short-subunit alcohol dehydrogenase family)